MHYLSKIAFFLLVAVFLSSCFKKVTCPAYQSQYLLDKELKLKRYSLFEEDSMPKPDIGDVKKSKFGIASNNSYYLKMREIKDLEMVTIYPLMEDSIEMATEAGDTLYADADTSAAITPSPYLTTFNNDQLIYNTLFGSTLESQRDSKEEIMEDLETEDQEVEEEVKEEKPGFFKRLFGKKDRSKEEPEEIETETGEEPAQPDPQPEEEEVDDGF